jgi:hypothetical protein
VATLGSRSKGRRGIRDLRRRGQRNYFRYKRNLVGETLREGKESEQVMNPSTKVAGLSFQLSRKTTPGADDHRPHDDDPASLARCADFRPHSDCEILYPATAYLPEPREHSVLKVHSRLLGQRSYPECLYPYVDNTRLREGSKCLKLVRAKLGSHSSPLLMQGHPGATTVNGRCRGR